MGESVFAVGYNLFKIHLKKSFFKEQINYIVFTLESSVFNL